MKNNLFIAIIITAIVTFFGTKHFVISPQNAHDNHDHSTHNNHSEHSAHEEHNEGVTEKVLLDLSINGQILDQYLYLLMSQFGMI